MTVAPESVPKLLLDLGLVRADELVVNGCEVENVGRRNQNYTVRFGDHRPGFFVKCPRQASDVGLIEWEASLTEYLGNRGLAQVVPALSGRLPDGSGAVYGYEPNGTLHRLLVDEKRVLTLPIRRCADALARIHSLDLADAPLVTPLPLLIPCPPIEVVTSFSAGGRELLELVHSNQQLMAALEKLKIDWRPDALVHGDIKWDNILVRTAGDSGRRTAVVIADWELGGVGDWRWDVGSFVSEYLRSWLLSFPVIEAYAPDLLLHQAQAPVASYHGSIRIFLSAYESRRRGPSGPVEELLPFVAARLLQTAFEISAESMRLDGRAVVMAQVSANIFDRPRDAATVLLGL